MLGDRPNQVERKRDDVSVSEEQLVDFEIPGGEITDDGLRTNVSVGVRYVDAWLQGVGAAAIDNLMEDAATAEISRAQVWSWVQAGRFDEARVRDEIAQIEASDAAKEVFAEVALTVPLQDFLTLTAYDLLGVSLESTKADDIAVLIEEAIVSGELAPGSVLRQEQLSERFGVSRTPVREALRRLAALGLVSFEPNRGVRVRTLTHEDLREAFLVRAELEALVTEEAARKITPEELVELEDCEKRFGRLTKEVRSHEPGGSRRSLMADWMGANHAFHDVLYRAADLPYVESVVEVGAAHVHRHDRVGAGRRRARRALRAQPGRAPRDPAGARRQLGRRRARARPRARHAQLRAPDDRPGARQLGLGRGAVESPHSRCVAPTSPRMGCSMSGGEACSRGTTRTASRSAGSRRGRARASTTPIPTRRARRTSTRTRRPT